MLEGHQSIHKRTGARCHNTHQRDIKDPNREINSPADLKQIEKGKQTDTCPGWFQRRSLDSRHAGGWRCPRKRKEGQWWVRKWEWPFISWKKPMHMERRQHRNSLHIWPWHLCESLMVASCGKLSKSSVYSDWSQKQKSWKLKGKGIIAHVKTTDIVIYQLWLWNETCLAKNAASKNVFCNLRLHFLIYKNL